MPSKLFEIAPSIKIVAGLPLLFLEDVSVLVGADLHLGIEAIMREEGTIAPHNQTDKITEIFLKHLENLKPKHLVLNGDVKHSFKEPSKIENRDVKKFIGEVASKVSQVHIVKGNHDLFLTWALQNFDNVKLYEEYFHLEKYFFVHGDKQLPKDITKEVEFIIIGHEHPVLEARIKSIQKVRTHAFMLGPLINDDRQIIVLPAFTDYSSGTPINPKNKNNLLSPILREKADLTKFEMFALSDEEVLHFPEFRLWY
jgi:putative SbcD/Mre11-related phosphoesterase